MNTQASIKSNFDGANLNLEISGILNIQTTPSLWAEVSKSLIEFDFKKVILDCSNIIECEGVGIALLFNVKKKVSKLNKEIEVTNLQKRFLELLNLFSDENQEQSLVQFYEYWYAPETVGKKTVFLLGESKKTIEFLGESFALLFSSLKNYKLIKSNEIVDIIDKSGINAIPIILLIGFLLGLIMSFQSAIPMQRFGAEIYVANLVALSLFRELGPLMTCVILAGRSASAFAAEIGTMKVSEEVDAIITMGLNPIQFLVVPRLLATLIISPILTIFFNLAGLLGSLLVIVSFNYPVITFVNQVVSAVKNKDMFGGLFKATIFGLVIAGIGCYHGLNTKTGASSVGESTTKSVVNGIISIAILDGIFSVLFFYLGL
jgi:phospholipid/cholesterol/gamma-HCH transport system permease protein